VDNVDKYGDCFAPCRKNLCKPVDKAGFIHILWTKPGYILE